MSYQLEENVIERMNKADIKHKSSLHNKIALALAAGASCLVILLVNSLPSEKPDAKISPGAPAQSIVPGSVK